MLCMRNFKWPLFKDCNAQYNGTVKLHVFVFENCLFSPVVSLLKWLAHFLLIRTTGKKSKLNLFALTDQSKLCKLWIWSILKLFWGFPVVKHLKMCKKKELNKGTCQLLNLYVMSFNRMYKPHFRKNIARAHNSLLITTKY